MMSRRPTTTGVAAVIILVIAGLFVAYRIMG
jgi:hypothetical protein